MRSLIDNFQHLIRKASRQTGMGVVAVGVREQPAGGAPTWAYTVENLNAQELDFAAQTILDLILEQGGDADCPCCVDRLERATAALAALRDKPAETPNALH